jgi:DNA topoisomerase-1
MHGGRVNNAGQNDASAPAAAIKVAASANAVTLARRLGLRYVSSDVLAIRRRRCGKGWSYLARDGRAIRDKATVQRLSRLAVPPAYQEVLYAEDPAAHLQAIGRDAAGRLQYRYHSDWEKVRETRKARRLARLAEVLPRIRRRVGRCLGAEEPTRELALAGVIELVASSAIRPGSESYARQHGTRGAATLLKSNVSCEGDLIRLTFRAKGGKNVVKDVCCPRLGKAIERLRKLPGRRLFQYRAEDGSVHHVTAQDVNRFLREIAGVHISLKDFRTLMASASVLEALARAVPAKSGRQRKKQVLEAVRAAAEDLHNTPTICRRSYVHDTVVTAFEDGVLERFAETLAACRTPIRRAQVLAEIIAAAA